MQDIKVTINGKEQTLTEEQMESISKMFPKDVWARKGDWARKDECGTYYAIYPTGDVTKYCDYREGFNDSTYGFGNYYPTQHIAEMRALDWKLNNLLFRYSMQHGGENVTASVSKYYMYYDFDAKKWECSEEGISSAEQGQVYFASFNVAQSAIHEVVEPFCEKHPEYLEWLRGEKR